MAEESVPLVLQEAINQMKLCINKGVTNFDVSNPICLSVSENHFELQSCVLERIFIPYTNGSLE